MFDRLVAEDIRESFLDRGFKSLDLGSVTPHHDLRVKRFEVCDAPLGATA